MPFSAGSFSTGRMSRSFSNNSRWARFSFGRHPNIDVDEQVPAAVSVDVRHALAANAEPGAGLRAFGNLDPFHAIERRHFQFGAERGLRHIDRHAAVQIATMPVEDRVLANLEDHVQIAVRTAVRPRIALRSKAAAAFRCPRRREC